MCNIKIQQSEILLLEKEIKFAVIIIEVFDI
jgi:hypothetical protein